MNDKTFWPSARWSTGARLSTNPLEWCRQGLADLILNLRKHPGGPEVDGRVLYSIRLAEDSLQESVCKVVVHRPHPATDVWYMCGLQSVPGLSDGLVKWCKSNQICLVWLQQQLFTHSLTHSFPDGQLPSRLSELYPASTEPKFTVTSGLLKSIKDSICRFRVLPQEFINSNSAY